MLEHSDRQNAQLSLILLVPAASIGVAIALFIAPGTIGTIVSVLCGVWLLGLPIAWSVLGDRYQSAFIPTEASRIVSRHGFGTVNVRHDSGYILAFWSALDRWD